MSGKSCNDALQRVYEYLDNELAPDDAQRIKQHFEKCSPCADQLNFCKRFQEAIRSCALDLPSAPPHLRSRIEQIIRDA